jgi:predicted TPR repeat methyltransferase
MRIRQLAAALLVLSCTGAAAAKDLRTAFIRLVPATDWKPTAGQALAVEVVSESAHADAAEFVKTFDATLREQLGLVLKYKIDDKAPTKLRIVIQEFDPGSAAMRFAVGFGTGKSYAPRTRAPI